MSENPTDGAAATGRPAAGQTPQPRFLILAQYVKDLSFENPGGPQRLQEARTQPNIQIRVDVQGEARGENRHEITLRLEIEAKVRDQALFLLDLAYAGLFEIANVPRESLQPLLMVECPRLIFPFARRIVADLTRDGGFPPLMLDPIDFVQLYRARLARGQGEPQAAGTSGDEGAPPAGSA